MSVIFYYTNYKLYENMVKLHIPIQKFCLNRHKFIIMRKKLIEVLERKSFLIGKTSNDNIFIQFEITDTNQNISLSNCKN